MERRAPHFEDLGLHAIVAARAPDHMGELIQDFEALVVIFHDFGPMPDPDNDATIFYTSGTPGRSNGAIGSPTRSAASSAHGEMIVAGVFGLSDQILGETVAAVIQLTPGSRLPASELQAFAAIRLAYFKSLPS